MKMKFLRTLFHSLLFATTFAGGTHRVFADDPFDIPKAAPTATLPASPLYQLQWEADHKEVSPKMNSATADVTFAFTNISDHMIVIDHLKPSCSCTAAKMPEQPWHIAPHTNGEIGVSVNLKGKAGEFTKTITVFFADSHVPSKMLSVNVKMPDRSKMRAANMQIALADRQAVFKGECASCHAEPAKTMTGLALYREICGICHDARPRNSVIPDLGLIKDHPTDYNFWRTNIANGKPGTMMPAFAQNQGGPLTEKQINDMAQMLDNRYPYARFAPQPANVQDSQAVKPASSVQKN